MHFAPNHALLVIDFWFAQNFYIPDLHTHFTSIHGEERGEEKAIWYILEAVSVPGVS